MAAAVAAVAGSGYRLGGDLAPPDVEAGAPATPAEGAGATPAPEQSRISKAMDLLYQLPVLIVFIASACALAYAIKQKSTHIATVGAAGMACSLLILFMIRAGLTLKQQVDRFERENIKYDRHNTIHGALNLEQGEHNIVHGAHNKQLQMENTKLAAQVETLTKTVTELTEAMAAQSAEAERQREAHDKQQAEIRAAFEAQQKEAAQEREKLVVGIESAHIAQREQLVVLHEKFMSLHTAFSDTNRSATEVMTQFSADCLKLLQSATALLSGKEAQSLAMQVGGLRAQVELFTTQNAELARINRELSETNKALRTQAKHLRNASARFDGVADRLDDAVALLSPSPHEFGSSPEGEGTPVHRRSTSLRSGGSPAISLRSAAGGSPAVLPSSLSNSMPVLSATTPVVVPRTPSPAKVTGVGPSASPAKAAPPPAKVATVAV